MVRWIAWIVVLLGVAAGAFWLMIGTPEGVETATVSRGKVRAMVEELGETRLARTYTVSMPVEGRVEPISLEVGDRVAAGDVVARLDTTALASRVEAERANIARLDAQMTRSDDDRLERTLIEQINAVLVSIDRTVEAAEEQTRSTRARLDVARQDREDISESYESGAATDIELRRARLEEVESEVSVSNSFLTLRAYEAVRSAARIGPRLVEQWIELKALDRAVLERERAEAEARLVALEDDLSRAEIRSPVDGVVLERAQSSERVLAAGTALLEIGRAEDLEVKIEMLTDEAGRVSAGDPVEIEWRATGEAIEGTVSRIEPRAFTKVSSLGVEQQRVLVIVALGEEARALSQDWRLGAAYRVRTRVSTGEASGLGVPRGAGFRGAGGGWRAFRLEGDRARAVGVELGLMNDASVEVTGGLGEGDEVIVSPPVDLREGQRVRRVSRDGG